MTEPHEARAARRRPRDIVARTSWDDAAAPHEATDRARRRLEAACAPTVETDAPARPRHAGGRRAGGRATPRRDRRRADRPGAAYHLGREADALLEASERVGGWCRSMEDNGFTFDYAGHIMFSNDPYVHELYEMLLGDNVHWQDREAWIYSKDVYTRYPFQGALYGLPPEVIKECIVGAIEARFGALKAPVPGATAPGDARRLLCDGGCGGPGARGQSLAVAPATAAETSRSSSTRSGARASPSTSPSRTTASSGRVPLDRDGDVLARRPRAAARPGGDDRGRARPVPEADGPERALRLSAARRLPGADGRLPAAAARRAATARTRDCACRPSQPRASTLDDGRTFRYEHLISTCRCRMLVAAIGDEAPPRALQAAASGCATCRCAA